MSGPLLLALWVGPAAASAAAQPDPQAQPDPRALPGAIEEVEALEERGRVAAAARRVEGLARDYPQDYGLRIWAGWLRYRAGHWRRAQRHYRQAIELSGGSVDSRLGLGWSLLD
ncbi:MAG: hypothetical protein KDK70_05950, partial [Myxococcales bacterium]|nr:hypothetical protein [Myxococcales bacterium]